MSNETQTSPLPLQPMHLPEPPSWLPLSWGWLALIATSLMLILVTWLVIRRNKKRQAPKITALRLLNTCTRPSEAIELLRQAAFCYYPRADIAQLTGNDWYEFLDSQIDTPRFVANQHLWQQALYSKEPIENSDELVRHCMDWVEKALPPKTRRN
ncbi:DUF4381 domain-containing protein [Vibrio japonicus]|uniref:DUF4381 domain-containing protein n=1 Tax=Vibrio japonicus TaxID=1824638 RepID=A0ABY5LKY8_9VIBR|nr:DUF4381 domain-containing protein [Vibrio japonicus]UUM32096.1 DUF4381 domain-containing protein [Vibrio japonicus]